MMADLGMTWANATASSGLGWDATRHYKQRPCFRHLTVLASYYSWNDASEERHGIGAKDTFVNFVGLCIANDG